MHVHHALPHELRDARLAQLREALRSSLWFLPVVFTLTALVTAVVVTRIDRQAAETGGLELFTRNVEDVRSLVATIAVSLLTFLGVVFSITIVAFQLASSQYSPRVLRSFVRNRLTQVTLALFIATFVFCIQVLASIQTQTEETGTAFTPALGAVVAQVLALACLFVFMAFVHSIVRSLRISHLIEEITEETRQAIEDNFPPQSAYVNVDAQLPDAPTDQVGLPSVGAIRGVEVDRLVHLAQRHGTVIRLRHMVGDYVADGEPVIETYGGTAPTPRELRRCFDIGVDRNFYQDAAYGFRQLVDIAIKALSPAINDPTTAVQVIDRLVDLLRRIGTRPEPSGVYLDDDGHVRLIRPVPTWSLFVDLAFTEIRRYGDDDPQISRRLQAAFLELEDAVADERDPALERQRELLRQRVERAISDPVERAHALEPDPRGLG